MKMSEAVVKGREMLEPRQGNDLFRPEEGCEKYGGCYRGMAVVGAGLLTLPIADDATEDDEGGFELSIRLLNEWPWSGDCRVVFPCSDMCNVATGGKALGTVAHILAHLWDRHVPLPIDSGEVDTVEMLDDPWTFERITDWLRTVEPQDETPQ